MTTLDEAVRFFLFDADVDFCRFQTRDDETEYRRLEVEITYKDGTIGHLTQSRSYPYEWHIATPFVPSLTE